MTGILGGMHFEQMVVVPVSLVASSLSKEKQLTLSGLELLV